MNKNFRINLYIGDCGFSADFSSLDEYEHALKNIQKQQEKAMEECKKAREIIKTFRYDTTQTEVAQVKKLRDDTGLSLRMCVNIVRHFIACKLENKDPVAYAVIL